VVPPKDFNLNNLENLWETSGKVDKNKKAVITYAALNENVNCKKLNNRQDINLKLTDKLIFSMSLFDKVNKGLANSNINCFMNVSLQSLIACPAFINMLNLVNE